MNGRDQRLNFPAGFRFHPTDEELVLHYLCRRCAGHPITVPIIAEIDLYKFDPWQLPGLSLYGEKEWYFFSPRDRKYPNGSRPNRAAGSGYWKATGADKPVGKPKALGIKKALVFYAGKAPRGIKTNWIMHEYRLANVNRSATPKNNNLRLDEWVLCRIYNKKGALEKHYNTIELGCPTRVSNCHNSNANAFPCNDMQTTVPLKDHNYPTFNPSGSSSSKHDMSPEFKEVQSISEFENRNEFKPSYLDVFKDEILNWEEMQYDEQLPLYQGMFGYMHKPF